MFDFYQAIFWSCFAWALLSVVSLFMAHLFFGLF